MGCKVENRTVHGMDVCRAQRGFLFHISLHNPITGMMITLMLVIIASFASTSPTTVIPAGIIF